MPEWLREALTNGDVPSIGLAMTRIGLGLVAGFVVAGVYVLGLGRRRDDGITLPTTLVLLTVVIAVVTMVIGSNLARAFGLVGALSIVRFRTVVEDTRDTAFVIFAVVVGMAIGAGYSLLAAIGIPAVLGAALVMRAIGPQVPETPKPTTLTVRIGLGLDPDTLLGDVLRQHLTEINLTGTGTAKQGAALELTYEVRLRDSAKSFALVADLNRIEGVQGVELRRA
jgi:uncharacterized membrane protein YhiD involved in acid resistance